jgi:hypothetical protein
MMVTQLHVMVRNTMRGMYTEQRGPVGMIECVQVSIDCEAMDISEMTQALIHQINGGIGKYKMANGLYPGDPFSLEVFPSEGRPKTSAQLAYEIGRAAEQILTREHAHASH